MVLEKHFNKNLLIKMVEILQIISRPIPKALLGEISESTHKTSIEEIS
jgi:hypothetical protein